MLRRISSLAPSRASPSPASSSSSSAVRAFATTSSPSNVGIKALYTYFPATYVDQVELEKFDNQKAGKYTIGLGQKNMAFCGEREDINSLCMSAVGGLLDNFSVDPTNVGRLEVGTETIIDKSKSVKTSLMELFAPSGNTSLEGIDTTNACYGGTSALFNSLQWVESGYWDGRDAIAVAGDIAVYEAGNARPTGGAGAVAMQVGPDAPLVFERGLRGSYFENAYDFYKPLLSSEYPVVDGPLSNTCYLRAIDACYNEYKRKFKNQYGREFSLEDDVDYALFHSPYTKLVLKSWARLHYLDFMSHKDRYPKSRLQSFASLSTQESYTDKQVLQITQEDSAESYAGKVKPSLLLPTELGNSYCGSLYTGLQSLVHHVANDTSAPKKEGKRALLFSYGSGLAATMFSLKIQGDVSQIAKKADIVNRLQRRKAVSPTDFTAALKRREETHAASSFTPTASTDDLFPGAYYLKNIDDKHRRTYARY